MSAAVQSAATDRCPRCGGGFHCGMNDAQACACTGLALDTSLQLRLRERFTGCLCQRCLTALAAGAPLDVRPPERRQG